MFDLIPFEQQFFRPFDDDFFGAHANSVLPCRTDIRDEGSQYVLEAELPGFRKDEIKVNVKDNCMTLTAQHKEENEQKNNEGQYVRRERRVTSMGRSFDVSDVQADKISARFENGVLTLTMPKKEAAKPLPTEITIE
ncbi:hypothetical protein B6259_06875 [Ruminococcaceae bacterium CPB6]|jgi:HSP20 family protein|uniref:Hsp20 family protein n=1 Tax=Caproicibacterium lactatifermentans TaxID=2666138 RepID=A0A859DPD2_9FIRM|nr:Hsp20/alpha crystallin family protein [Caproicibacterium lactatifermentans]ARP50626.1 hypothetical protein B6259_06875 [Ruminococcaceae bacterium CPB6]MDD4807260.1 Hsp20/alpha crystallin family protein [Oscillospiraceae bacterium]QKN23640.1 Hsp20 family protein [Caproicibacterium lactatifermentans]